MWALIELPVGGRAEVVAAAVGAVGAMSLAGCGVQMRHPSPAIDLAAVRLVPMWAKLFGDAAFLAAAFGAMLLGSVMFLTTVWRKSRRWSQACACSPGPAVVVIVSLTITARLIGRIGVGAVAATGAAVYVVGIVIWSVPGGS